MVNMNAMKTGSAGSVLVLTVKVVFCLVAAGGTVLGASSSEAALRARAEKLYAAIQRGDWKEGEKYIAKDSKPLYRSQTKRPILASRISSVKIDPGGDTATVVMQVPMRTAFSPQPVLISQGSSWRLEHGVWYLVYPQPDEHAKEALFNPQEQPRPAAPPKRASFDLKFDSMWAGLGYIHPGEVKVAQFHFANVSQHPVTLAEVEMSGACLRLKTQQKEFKPGEAGVLEFELDPSVLGLNSEQSLSLMVTLKTEPGGGSAQLTIGAVYEPEAEPAPKK